MDIIKNPVFIGFIAGLLTYGYMNWDIENKNKKKNKNRKNLIIFTHRLSRDKQPQIAVQLRKMLPNYEFIYTHKRNLPKDKYYDLLSQSKLVYSCADHENLGIGMMEGALCGCVPLVPDRLSYSEIFDDTFKYETVWTDTWTHFLYERYQIKMAEKIVYMMENYEMFHVHKLREQLKVIKNDF